MVEKLQQDNEVLVSQSPYFVAELMMLAFILYRL